MLDEISNTRLQGVHPDLVRVVRAAALMLPFRIRITCGMRTVAEQRVLVSLGKSRTMKSLHLRQPDGHSHAVDTVAMFDGEPDWASENFFTIAEAFRTAANQCAVRVTWGGIWHPPLNDIHGPLTEYRKQYVAMFTKEHGRKPFFDGPHFQL